MNIDFTIYDDELNAVDTADMEVSDSEVRTIVDLACQLVLERRCSNVFNEQKVFEMLDEVLVDAGVLGLKVEL